MPRYVSLSKLPPGLEFPADLAPRISYDASAKRLLFEGFMSKAVYDRLHALSDESDYKRAIEALFQICTFDDEPRRQPKWIALAFVGVGTALAVTFAVALLRHG